MEINLPDGSAKELEKGSNGLDLAKSIGAGLAKSAVAVVVNGEQRDLLDELPDKSSVSIITIQSDEGLEIMRHTLTAQVLAKAIKNLYSDSRLAIGPTIENGFYYDVSTETPISVEDLPKIENEMKRILENKSNIVKSLHSEKDAKKMFKQKGESLKVEIIDDYEQTDNFRFIQMLMKILLIYAEDLIYQIFLLLEHLNLLKSLEHTGREILQMKCLQEFMELHGEMKKSFKNI